MAQRQGNGPFVVDPTPQGYVAFSLGVSDDELTIFGTRTRKKDPTATGGSTGSDEEYDDQVVDVFAYQRSSINDTPPQNVYILAAQVAAKGGAERT